MHNLTNLPAAGDSDFRIAIHLPHRHLQDGAVMPEVYSWLFPPVREKIKDFLAEYPMQRFLENIHPGLDDAHKGLFDAYTSIHAEVKGLGEYSHTYPLGGSSEGIFHLVAHCATHYPSLPLYALKDEYKGYEAFAQSLGKQLQLLDEDDLLTSEPGILFISNPSARDGNFLSTQLFNALVDKHKTIVDLAYVGLAPAQEIDLTHENIFAVVTSLSKPYGLYYYRVGMMWSRLPIPSLYGNRWFKNLHGILMGEFIMRQLALEGVDEMGTTLYKWTAARQQKAIQIINQDWGTQFRACDVALLAWADHVPKQLEEQLARFRRGSGYRICLTPLMMSMEGDMPSYAMDGESLLEFDRDAAEQMKEGIE